MTEFQNIEGGGDELPNAEILNLNWALRDLRDFSQFPFKSYKYGAELSPLDAARLTESIDLVLVYFDAHKDDSDKLLEIEEAFGLSQEDNEQALERIVQIKTELSEQVASFKQQIEKLKLDNASVTQARDKYRSNYKSLETTVYAATEMLSEIRSNDPESVINRVIDSLQVCFDGMVQITEAEDEVSPSTSTDLENPDNITTLN